MKTKFYTVSAHYDLYSHNDWEIKNFLEIENAVRYADKLKNKFISEVANGKLDEDWSDGGVRHDGTYYFYGVDKDGENIANIEVYESEFEDE